MQDRLTQEEQADAAAELFLQSALEKRVPTPRHTGSCLYCKTPVQHNAAFCDADCREDFEFINKKR